MTSPDRTADDSASAGRRLGLGTVLEELQKFLGKTIGRLVGFGSLSVLIVYGVQRLRTPDVVLVPITLPGKLAESGLSSRELTERLMERIRDLREAARPTPSDPGWGIEDTFSYPDIEIGGVKWSFASISSLLNGFGHQTKRVAWELSAHPRALAPSHENWVVTAAVTGGRLHQAAFRLDAPDSALSAIAIGVLEDAEPGVAIRMYRFRRRCDDARRLAIRQFNLASTPQERSVAFTTLGFVAECAFDRTGPNVHEAEGFYRHAIAEDSGNAQAHANLARIVSDRGDSVNLWRPRFERAIALAPKTAATYEAWGNALLLNGEPGAGIDKLEEALRIDPSSSTVQVHLGYAYLYRGRRGDTAVAIRRLSTAVLRNPDAAVLTKYGELLLKNREWVAAADAYRRAADLDPKNLELRFLLAVALDSGARKYEARELLLDLARQTLDTSAYCSAAKRYVPDLVRCGTTLAMRRPD